MNTKDNLATNIGRQRRLNRRLQVLTSEADMTLFKSAAATNGLTLSKWVRRCLQLALDSRLNEHCDDNSIQTPTPIGAEASS